MASCLRCGKKAQSVDVFCAACRDLVERVADGRSAAPDIRLDAGGGLILGPDQGGTAGDGRYFRPGGVDTGGAVRFESALALAGDPDGHAGLDLENADLVGVADRMLTFHPFYVTEFDASEKPAAAGTAGPELAIRGACYTDAETAKVLYVKDHDGNESDGIYECYGHEVVARDLLEKPPSRVDMSLETVITEIQPTFGTDECDARVRELVLAGMEEAGEADAGDGRAVRTVRCKTSTVLVPMLHIEFECAGRAYTRIVVMSSDTVIYDEIAECHHASGKRGACPVRAAAVCARCGRPMCRRHIARAGDGGYRCARRCAGPGGAGRG